MCSARSPSSFGLPLVWLLLAPTKTDHDLLYRDPFAVGTLRNIKAAWLAAVIASLPVAIVFVASQRALVRGIVGGATTGS